LAIASAAPAPQPEPSPNPQPIPQQAAPPGAGFTPPVPVSLVATPYPPSALFGGEVVLDAVVDSEGRVADVNVVSGQAPFVDPVVSAVRTWTFTPASAAGQAVESHIGIVFQFPQSFLPKIQSPERDYVAPPPTVADHGALPVMTLEPNYPPNTVAEGSVAIYAAVDDQGRVTGTRILQNVDALTEASQEAITDWRFSPAKRAGAKAPSAVVIVETFRHP
jgi:outer membrane biosynthesis protein TonB